jgi:hypothetical protein
MTQTGDCGERLAQSTALIRWEADERSRRAVDSEVRERRSAERQDVGRAATRSGDRRATRDGAAGQSERYCEWIRW